MAIKYPLEIKGLLVRVTLAGHIGKPVWVRPKGRIAMARSLLIRAHSVAKPAREPMNPAEEIVKFWLQKNGYFIQSSTRVPLGRGREIDILALHEKDNKKKHIEVSVAVRMQAIGETVETLAVRFAQKFNHERIAAEVHRKFHDNLNYTKELVVGEVRLGGQDVLPEFTAECGKHGILVIPISTILKEIVPDLGGHTHLNPIIRTIQIMNKFLCSSSN